VLRGPATLAWVSRLVSISPCILFGLHLLLTCVRCCVYNGRLVMG
jgi:hypothetical protein